MSEKSKTIEIKISDVLKCLTQGYTRTKGEKNYDASIGSIQEKYDLNKSQIFELFKHEKLKGRKTIVKKAPAFIVLDDTIIDTEDKEFTVVDNLEQETSQEDENTEEVSTPDTQTPTGMDDSTEEAKVDTVETDNQELENSDTWLSQ